LSDFDKYLINYKDFINNYDNDEFIACDVKCYNKYLRFGKSLDNKFLKLIKDGYSMTLEDNGPEYVIETSYCYIIENETKIHNTIRSLQFPNRLFNVNKYIDDLQDDLLEVMDN
jgi:hypothetical protein